MPSDFALKAMNRVHRTVLALTGNRLAETVSGMQVLELTTTGRQTGRPRTVMLTAPLREGGAWVVVASRGGDDFHPRWYLNLCANPDVTVALPGRAGTPMRARTATAAERARLWPQIADQHKHYRGYQSRTEREIPLVLLEPVG